jgi:hypothetical protein
MGMRFDLTIRSRRSEKLPFIDYHLVVGKPLHSFFRSPKLRKHLESKFKVIHLLENPVNELMSVAEMTFITRNLTSTPGHIMNLFQLAFMDITVLFGKTIIKIDISRDGTVWLSVPIPIDFFWIVRERMTPKLDMPVKEFLRFKLGFVDVNKDCTHYLNLDDISLVISESTYYLDIHASSFKKVKHDDQEKSLPISTFVRSTSHTVKGTIDYNTGAFSLEIL